MQEPPASVTGDPSCSVWWWLLCCSARFGPAALLSLCLTLSFSPFLIVIVVFCGKMKYELSNVITFRFFQLISALCVFTIYLGTFFFFFSSRGLFWNAGRKNNNTEDREDVMKAVWSLCFWELSVCQKYFNAAYLITTCCLCITDHSGSIIFKVMCKWGVTITTHTPDSV